MIIFLNDDRAYLSWVTHHRRGFVLDGKRKPKLGHLMIHRATCPEIKAAPSRRTHWTTGTKLKACSLDRTELEAWAAEETSAAPGCCESCQPRSDGAPEEAGPVHLSKLASEILEYILEAALIHLEVEQPPYRLTVSDIAACFAKTPGQISPVLHRLVDDGLVTIQGRIGKVSPLPRKHVVLPTMLAMRTLEAFQDASNDMIEGELSKLHAD